MAPVGGERGVDDTDATENPMDRIKHLKSVRSGLVSYITRLSNDVKDLLCSGCEPDILREKRAQIVDTIERIGKLCDELRSLYESAEDKLEVSEYLDGKLAQFQHGLDTIDAYIVRYESELGHQRSDNDLPPTGQRTEDTLEPGDSASQTSRHTIVSVSSSFRAQMEAKKARMKEEMLRQQQDLAAKELRLKHEREMLEATTARRIAEDEARMMEELSVTGRAPSLRGEQPEPAPRAAKTYAPRITPSPDVGNIVNNIAQAITSGFALPPASIVEFCGDPTDFNRFICAFESCIESKVLDDQLKLNYLIQYCKGEALSLVKECVTFGPELGFKKAKQRLKERYGSPFLVARSYIRRVTEGAEFRLSDRKGLQRYADLLTDCRDALDRIGYQADVNASDNLRRMVKRLPLQWRSQWLSWVANIEGDDADSADVGSRTTPDATSRRVSLVSHCSGSSSSSSSRWVHKNRCRGRQRPIAPCT